ncbi:MAG: protein kinase [Gemmataceae bacterium]
MNEESSPRPAGRPVPPTPAPGPTPPPATTDESQRTAPHVTAPHPVHEPGRDWRAFPCVPGYRIEGELGRGGMGVVYKAQHLALKRMVALKMIRGSGAGASELARFRTEAEALARLQHPHIVQIHEVGEFGGDPYFSLEFVPGGTLLGKLAREPQPPANAARLVETLARAIGAAHAAGIIHRDLKPANVLLTAAGEPKVTDFGLAKRLGEDSGQTRTGQVMGTPSYMAPEQAAGRADAAGPAADIYALGAILYECLTGRPPFQGASVSETLEQVRTQEPVPPRRLVGQIPRDLETVCLKCLEKETTRRYMTCEDLADDLRRFREGRAVVARPVGGLERAAKWVRRKPAVAGLLAAGVLLALALVGGAVSLGFAARMDRLRELAVSSEDEAKTRRAEAERNAQEADAQRRKADENAQEADAQRRKADENATRADAERLRAERIKFAADMNAAMQAWHDGQISRMEEILKAHIPATGRPDLRGFEWHYLWRLLRMPRPAATLTPGYYWTFTVAPDGKTCSTFGFQGVNTWSLEDGRHRIRIFPVGQKDYDTAFCGEAPTTSSDRFGARS